MENVCLENLNVNQLRAEETRRIEGGNPIALGIAIVALVIAVANTDWDQVAYDVSRGWNDGWN